MMNGHLLRATSTPSPAVPRPGRSAAVASALAGAHDMAPVVVALAPLALTLGAAIAASPLDDRIGWAGAALVYAASAHATAVAMLGAGAAAPAVVLAVLVLAARGVVYSAGLVPRMRGQPAWFRWVGPYLLVDPLYALVTARTTEDDPPARVRGYYLGAGLALWAMWLPVVGLGIRLGPVLPRDAGLEFALPAMLVAFLVPGLRSRPALVAAVAGGLAGAAATGLPGGLGLVAGTLAGTAAAVLYERVLVERRAS